MCTQNSSDRSLNSKHTSQSFQVTPIRHTKYPISRNRWGGGISCRNIENIKQTQPKKNKKHNYQIQKLFSRIHHDETNPRIPPNDSLNCSRLKSANRTAGRPSQEKGIRNEIYNVEKCDLREDQAQRFPTEQTLSHNLSSVTYSFLYRFEFTTQL